ncbi:MAG: DUF1559 domain-containing protein [Gemmataceae bacterium]|nr:DUF1559 domain-containing protein [Gemmataceae bacterium]
MVGERCATLTGGFGSGSSTSMDSDSGESVINNTAYQDGSSPGTGSLGFGSAHAGGMLMLLCDGSVRGFPFGAANLSAIVSRNGGEVVSLPD